jgi:hypothetical protein
MRLASRDVATPFVHDVLAHDGSVWVRESSDSMAPLVRASDRLRLVPLDGARIRPGQLLAYRRGAHLVVHRVLTTSRTATVTKGDALPERDAPVGRQAILGRVVAVVGAGERVHDLTRLRWRIAGRLVAWCSRLAEAVSGSRIAWALARLPVHVLARLAR